MYTPGFTRARGVTRNPGKRGAALYLFEMKHSRQLHALEFTRPQNGARNPPEVWPGVLLLPFGADTLLAPPKPPIGGEGGGGVATPPKIPKNHP